MNRFIDINPERCIGCGTCQSACADAHRMQALQDTPRLALVKTGGISAAPSRPPFASGSPLPATIARVPPAPRSAR